MWKVFAFLFILFPFLVYAADPGGFTEEYWPAQVSCISSVEYIKCARLPRTDFLDPYINGLSVSDGVALDDTNWTHIRDGVLVTGYGFIASQSALTGSMYSFLVDCTVVHPYNVTFFVVKPGPQGTSAASICASLSYNPNSFTNENVEIGVSTNAVALDGDMCPDGFFTVSNEKWCGDGMVNAANVPYCADDTSGEYCLLPATVPCGLGVTMIKTSTGVNVPLYAEKYTSPALHIAINGGICYANLEIGTATEAININYNGVIYHTVD